MFYQLPSYLVSLQQTPSSPAQHGFQGYTAEDVSAFNPDTSKRPSTTFMRTVEAFSGISPPLNDQPQEGLIYKVDDKPPWHVAFFFGMQVSKLQNENEIPITVLD